jgi:hypothetical protein
MARKISLTVHEEPRLRRMSEIGEEKMGRKYKSYNEMRNKRKEK